MRIAIWPALAAGIMASAGCGGSDDYGCKDMCADANACTGVTQAMDCGQACGDIGALNGASNCGDSFDGFVQCLGDHKDLVCQLQNLGTTSTPCDAQAFAYGGCVYAYCNANPTDPGCQDLPL